MVKTISVLELLKRFKNRSNAICLVLYKAFLIWSAQQLCKIGKANNMISFPQVGKVRLSEIEGLSLDHIGINYEIGIQYLFL